MKKRSHAVTAVSDELPVVMEWSLKLLLVSVMMVKMSSADSLQVGSPDGRTDWLPRRPAQGFLFSVS